MRLRPVVLVSVASALLGGAAPAFAATLCVGSRPACHDTLQEAIDAAHDGDTIRMGAGTFAGGATIDKSVTVIGAGRRATVVKGGGPVVTVGRFGDENEPTVSISDLTITGGRTTSSAESEPFTGQEGVLAAGGGIAVPPGALDDEGNVGPGATLTLSRVSVSDNRAAPTETAPFGPPCPGGDPCPFAQAAGGGISSWGPLTIEDSLITGNSVGSASGISDLASDTGGAGIFELIGELTITRSRITDNHASATGHNARFAEGGGIYTFGERFSMSDSVLTGNSSLLKSQLPTDVEQLANAGGAHITDAVATADVERTLIAGNSTRATNSVGASNAFSGGIHVDSPVDFTMSNSVVTGNDASAATFGSSTDIAHADSGGGQLFGALLRSSVRENTVRADSQRGDAEAFAGGLWVLFGDVHESELRDNRLLADSPLGRATVRGGAAVIDSDPDAGQGGLTATRSSFRGNDGFARGLTAIGQGGGIYDGLVSDDGPFGGGPLTLIDSSVTHNAVRGLPKGTLQGGGIYVKDQPVTLIDTLLAHNKPDQCFGCANAAKAPPRHARGGHGRRGGDPVIARLARR